MSNIDNNEICSEIKQNIELLINDKKFDEAKSLIDEYKKIKPDDIEIYSMEGIIFMTQGKLNEAEEILKHGLDIDSCNFDLNYNLAYVYGEQKKYDDSLKYYEQALKNCSDENMKKEIEVVISKLENEYGAKVKTSKIRIVFFDKGDDKFIWDIINELSKEYETKHVRVTNYNQIDEGMQWADICWFEWCDELVIYGSKLSIAKEKKIICRLHRYEALTDYPRQVTWDNVDKLIIVADHLKKFLLAQIPDLENKVDIVTIKNGVNIGKYKFQERKPGFNVAYIGYIHARKNPALILQIMNALVKKDKRYKLYVAGQFQDPLIELYCNDQISKMNLKSNIIFQGWQNDIGRWLDNKNYILSASIHESFGYGIAEAMSRGVKPVIHNFLFADEIWGKKFMYNSIDEAVKMITENDYNSEQYRAFIENNYSLKKQLIGIRNLLSDLFEKKNEKA